MTSTTLHKYHLGSGVNIMAGLFAHIPCCGSQILFSLFGLQAIGSFSSTILYPFQFIIPLVSSAVLTGMFIGLSRRHARHDTNAPCQHQCASHHHKSVIISRDVWRFFAINLAFGYTIVVLLYLFIPPHSHYAISGDAQAQFINHSQEIAVTYHDSKRFWPWSQRHFMAQLDNKLTEDSQTLRAEEIPWYQAMWHHADKSSNPIHARIYSRINASLLLNPLVRSSALEAPPVQYFLKLNPTGQPATAQK